MEGQLSKSCGKISYGQLSHHHLKKRTVATGIGENWLGEGKTSRNGIIKERVNEGGEFFKNPKL